MQKLHLEYRNIAMGGKECAIVSNKIKVYLRLSWLSRINNHVSQLGRVIILQRFYAAVYQH